MLSIIAQSDIDAPAYNDIFVKLQTNNYVTTAGVAATQILQFTGNPSDGETLTITFQDNAIVFTFKTIPDTSGLQLPINGGALSLINYVTNVLVPALLANYTLAQYFYLTAPTGTTTVSTTLTAKNTGTAYTPTVTNTMAHFSLSTAVAGVNQAVRPDFKILCDVYLAGTPYGTKIAALEATPDTGNNAVFEFSRQLLAQLGANKPGLGETSSQPCPDMRKKYFLQYMEQYSGAIQKMTTGSSFYAVNSKLEFELFPGNTFYIDHFYGTSPDLDRNFFTNQPRTKKISPLQPEWLYWYHDASGGNLKLYADITYTDGTTTTANVILDAAATADTIYRIPVGLQNNPAIAAVDGTKTIASYIVYAQSVTSTMFSEKFTYTVDYAVYRNRNFFLFRNLLGGYDTLWCRGDVSEGRNYGFTEYDPILNYDYAAADPGIKQQITDNLRGWNFNTGWLTLPQQQNLEEFFSSPERLLLLDPDNYISINMDETNIITRDTSTAKFAYTFKIKAAFNS